MVNCNIPRAYIPASAIMKPVGDTCNLRCDYCYYRADHKLATPCASSRMTYDMADQAMRQLLDLGDKVQFIWHGGEPLLAGKDFYREIIKLQASYPKDSFTNCIQTNATLIDEEWAEFFAEHKFGVGVSLDGPEEVHNSHRFDGMGHGGFANTIAGIRKLQAAGNKVSGIAVITKNSLAHAKAITQFYLDLKILNFSLNPLFEDDLEFAVTADEYAAFLCEVFDSYAVFENPSIIIEPLESIVKPHIGEYATRCAYSGLCARHIVIKNDGSISPCDRFNGRDYEFGNVLNGGLNAVIQSKKRQEFIQLILDRLESCSSCKWFKFCQGSCTIGYIHDPDMEGDYCRSNKGVFQYIDDNFKFEVASNRRQPQNGNRCKI